MLGYRNGRACQAHAPLRLAAPARAGRGDPARRSSTRPSGCSSSRATRRRRWRRSRAEAGVALKTVYVAFETKSGVLRALWHLLPARRRGRRAGRRARVVPRGARRARPGAPAAAERAQLARGQGARRRAAGRDPQRGAGRPRHRGAVGADPVRVLRQPARDRAERCTRRARCGRASTSTRAADILWTLNHPDVWQLLVGERGWTPRAYEQLVRRHAPARSCWAGAEACAARGAPSDRCGQAARG